MSDQSVLQESGASSGDPFSDQLVRLTSKEGAVRTGDIIAIQSDTDTAWKTNDKYWYAYVQGRKITARGNELRLI